MLGICHGLILHVISKSGLLKQIESHPACKTDTLKWFAWANKLKCASFAELRAAEPDLDRVGSAYIFNLKHNTYRLIVTIHFPSQSIWVKALLTHKEYDRKDWMKWA